MSGGKEICTCDYSKRVVADDDVSEIEKYRFFFRSNSFARQGRRLKCNIFQENIIIIMTDERNCAHVLSLGVMLTHFVRNGHAPDVTHSCLVKSIQTSKIHRFRQRPTDNDRV